MGTITNRDFTVKLKMWELLRIVILQVKLLKCGNYYES
ncbi:hypothetical protein LEP1GSC018_0729 [Leptospira kirschneri str. 2008720114]|nr:hypothetical protein LEP1GSC018_0729 [Leptospira kirschneri str. 2008720114]